MSGSKSGGFTITFKAVDGATTTIQGINKQLTALTKPIEAFGKANKSFGGVQGLTALTGGMKQFGGEAFSVFKSLDRIVPELGAITGAASLAGMAAFSKSWATAGQQVGYAAQGIGIAATKLHDLQGAAKLAGLSADAMTDALAGLATHLRDALGGRDTHANLMMQMLFGPTGAPDEMKKSVDQVLIDVADRIKALKNPQDQQRAADALGLGGILPILRKGSAEIRRLQAEAGALDPFTPEMIQRANDEAKAWNRLGLAIHGVYDQLGDETTGITPYLNKLSLWIEKHREAVGEITAIGAAMMAIRPAPWLLRLLGVNPLTASAAAIVETPGDTANTPAANRPYDPIANPNLTDPYGAIGMRIWGAPHRPGVGPRAGSPGPAVPYSAGGILGDVGATQSQYDVFKTAVAGIEHARYNQMGGAGGRYAGRYQMGPAEIAETARRLFERTPTQQEFLSNPAMQERYFEAYTDAHHLQLMRESAQYRAMSPEQRLAVLGYAHNQGVRGAEGWLNTGQVGRDAFGTGGDAYSKAVAAGLTAANQAPPAPGARWGVDTPQSGHVQVDVHIRGPAGAFSQLDQSRRSGRAAAAR